LAALLLGEKYTKIEFGCAISGLIGIVLITRPPFLFSSGDTPGDQETASPNRIFGIIAALVASLSNTFMFLVIRKINKSSSTLVIIQYFNFFSATYNLIGMMYQGVKAPNLHEIGLLVIIGFLSHLQQACTARGLQLEKAGKASALNYLQVMLGFFYDILIFHSSISTWSIAGTMCILASAVYLFMQHFRPEAIPQDEELDEILRTSIVNP